MKIEITYYDNKIAIESLTENDDFVSTDDAIDMTISLLKGLGYQNESIIKSLATLAQRELIENGIDIEELYKLTSLDYQCGKTDDECDEDEAHWTCDKYMDGYEIHSLKLSDHESYEIHSNSRLDTGFSAYHFKGGDIQFIGLYKCIDDALEDIDSYSMSNGL